MDADNKNALPNITVDSLPREIFERCLSFLDAKDLCFSVELVCKSFRIASRDSDSLWRSIALYKYGDEILENAISTDAYSCRLSFKEMVADDMRLVAMPTISMAKHPKVCRWMYHSVSCSFVCLVLGIQYYRPAEEVRIYIDVRGETDLRHPRTSSISHNYSARTIRADRFHGISYCPGYYQGYVSFGASFFQMTGRYSFTYGDIGFPHHYIAIDILEIQKSSSLESNLWKQDLPKQDYEVQNRRSPAFNKSSLSYGMMYTPKDWLPFFTNLDDESRNKAELKRFRPFVVSPQLLHRHQRVRNNTLKW